MKSALRFFPIAALALGGATVRADAVDDLIARQMASAKIPGLTLMVVRDGKVIKHQAYGVVDNSSKQPVTIDTMFETGSIGKAYTATVVMQLVNEGKLRLEDSITRHLPEAPPTWKDVTIRHMLAHQSGLPEYVVIPGLGLIDTYTREAFFKGIVGLPLDFKPGSQFQYSNTNFALLGEIVEKITGRPFKEVVHKRVFDRAGLRNTLHLKGAEWPKAMATGYLAGENGGDLITGLRTTTSGTGADGIFASTSAELVKFAQAIQAGRLLPKSTVAMMQQAGVLSNGRKAGYGLGWFVRKYNGKRMISHGGNSVGYSASIAMFPDSGLVIGLMCNIYPVQGDNLARQIAEIYDPSLSTKVLTVREDPHPKLTAWLLRAAKALAEGKTDEAELDPDFAAQLATPRGQMMRGGFAPFRQIEKLEYLVTEDEAPDRIIRYRTKLGERTMLVTFVLTKDRKIFSLGARPE